MRIKEQETRLTLQEHDNDDDDDDDGCVFTWHVIKTDGFLPRTLYTSVGICLIVQRLRVSA